ncbi:hypothetical protein CKY10_04355 [Photorhabdus sp. HUG-39]|uniref:Uncharacterized protein n=2 Tax=Photorhabdus TaxID=29487 RepID=A0A329VIX9_9GAMM|nr:hypothetical protein [Photorhabdus sp. RW14-46]PQQ31955.1 hypothetical protein C6H64_04895 [Photorhabdus luminescens]PQQ37421.1 hypothetical protein C6H68_13425 [Photorhabdus luminescens]RAW90967.1 hypothetical protein CKY01_10545 [Photorhabdus laumondii subsp. clarkei]RAX11469.1 hypothetical protein CKY10_04355 [Photorhabdus sp. HUG-39]
MQRINNVLVNSSVIAEDKLAVMMMFCFQLLSSTNTERVNMRISDGRLLTLKFEENLINH